MKLAEEKTFSEEMAWLIDQEIASLIRGAEGKALELVLANRAKLDALAAALLEEETLDGKRVDEILSAA
jgi:cell division protease FtsH